MRIVCFDLFLHLFCALFLSFLLFVQPHKLIFVVCFGIFFFFVFFVLSIVSFSLKQKKAFHEARQKQNEAKPRKLRFGNVELRLWIDLHIHDGVGDRDYNLTMKFECFCVFYFNGTKSYSILICLTIIGIGIVSHLLDLFSSLFSSSFAVKFVTIFHLFTFWLFRFCSWWFNRSPATATTKTTLRRIQSALLVFDYFSSNFLFRFFYDHFSFDIFIWSEFLFYGDLVLWWPIALAWSRIAIWMRFRFVYNKNEVSFFFLSVVFKCVNLSRTMEFPMNTREESTKSEK